MPLFDSIPSIIYSDTRFTDSDFALAWGDVNNDGINELLVSPFTITPTDQPVFLIYTGTGFSDKNIVISDGGFANTTGAGFEIFDIDNDGQKEVLFLNNSDVLNQILEIWKYSDGALRQTGITLSDFSSVAPITDISAVKISDVNYLFAADTSLQNIRIFNLSDTSVFYPSIPTPPGTSGVSVRDIDCDGLLEMAVSAHDAFTDNFIIFFRLANASDITSWMPICDLLPINNGAPFDIPQSVVFANLSDSCQWDLIVTDQSSSPADIAVYKKSCDSILCFTLTTGNYIPIFDTVCCKDGIIASWTLNNLGATCSDDSDVGFITLTRPSDSTTVILQKETTTVTFSFSDCQVGSGSLTFFRKCAFCSDFSDSFTIPLTFCDCSQPGQVYWVNASDNTMWVGTISDLTNPTTPFNQTLLMSGSNLVNPSGISIDISNSKVYWTNQGDNTIRFGTISDLANPSEPIDQMLLISDGNVAAPSGLFVDILFSKIYWANSSNNTIWFGTISDLANPTEPNDQTILMSDGNLNGPSGLFVDPFFRKIYWTNLSDNTMWVGTISDLANPTEPNDQTLLMSDNNLAFPTDVFVDLLNSKIYWTNLSDNTLWVGAISDLANPTTPTDQTLLMSDGNLVGPAGISIVSNGITTLCGCSSPIIISDLYGGPTCTDLPFDIFFSFDGASDAHCTLTFDNVDYEGDFTAGPNSFNVPAPSIASDYLAILSAFDLLNSDCSDVQQAIITVDAPVSDLTIAVTPSDAVCPGTAVTLTASGAHHYLWFDGTSDNPHADFTPTQTSDYKVIGYSQNNACSSDASISITVKQRPVITVEADSDTVCSGTAVTLTASGAQTYVWFDGSDGSVHTFIPAAISDYRVTGTSDGCSSDTFKHIIVKTPVTVNAGSDQTIVAGSDAPIGVGLALSDVLYTWFPSDGISDIHAFPTTAHPTFTTTYTVIAKRTDMSDCTSSDSVIVNVLCFMKLSDIHFVGNTNTLTGFQFSNKDGTRIITATYSHS